MRTLGAVTAVASLGIVSLSAREAGATTYVITTNNMTMSASGCGFMEAIASINAGSGKAGCANPTALNTIELQHAGPYVTAASPNPTQILVNRSVNVIGKGTAKTIRASNGFKVQATSGFDVTVNLENLTIEKHTNQIGTAPGLSAHGHTTRLATLFLNRVKVTGFTNPATAAVYLFSPVVPQPVAPHGRVYFESHDSIITSNLGPGLYAQGAMELRLYTTTVSFNNAGGLRLLHGAFTHLNYSTVEGNFIDGDGGGIYAHSTEATDPGEPEGFQNLSVVRSAVLGNTATGDGGGIFYSAQHGLKLERSTISGNVADRGGGVFSDDLSYGDSEYTTIVFNDALSMGGGFYKTNRGTGSPLFNKDIVARNTLNGITAPSVDGTDIFTEGNTCDAHYTLLGTLGGHNCNEFPESNNLVPEPPFDIRDPRIEEVASYLGGPTRVHRFMSDSPALDYTPAIVWDDFTEIDVIEQRGLAAPADYNFTYNECSVFGDPVQCEHDLGAYEAGSYTYLGQFMTTQKPAPIVYNDSTTGKRYLELFITAMDGDIGWMRAEIPTGSTFGLPSSYTGQWSPLGGYQSLTFGNTSHGPSAVVYNNLAHLFVTKADNRLWYLVRNANGTLGAWQDLGFHTTIGSGPSAVNVNNSRLYVFVRGTNNQLKYRVFTQSTGTWGGWSTALGTATVSSVPAAVYLGGATNKLYVFVQKNDRIAYKSCNPSSCTWSSWVDIDATTMVSGPSASARGTNSIEVCAKNNVTNGPSCNTLTGSTWSGWQARPFFGSGLEGPPASVSRGDGVNNNDTVDIFAVRDNDLSISHQQTPW